MPKGPKGEKRPADVIGAAVKVMQIATGEIEEDTDDDGKNKAAVELGRKGGKARAFLDANNVPYEVGQAKHELPSADVAARARDFTVLVECWK